jgi:hypothetical protein
MLDLSGFEHLLSVPLGFQIDFLDFFGVPNP